MTTSPPRMSFTGPMLFVELLLPFLGKSTPLLSSNSANDFPIMGLKWFVSLPQLFPSAAPPPLTTMAPDSNFVNHALPLPAPDGPPGSHHNTGAGGGSDQGISGALGQGPQVANGINTFNTFWIYCVPLLGAYVADEHWGRYKTICVSIAIAIVGHIILVISAIPPVITNQTACFAVFMLGVIIMGFGTGGFKPNISPLIVEQIDVTHAFVKTLPSGERVVVDPIITQSRIYHYFYLFINIGALIGQIGMVGSSIFVLCPHPCHSNRRTGLCRKIRGFLAFIPSPDGGLHDNSFRHVVGP